MRKTRRVDDSIEFFSVQRAEDSIARCDIAILVLDAEMDITEQDKKIADVIVENRKACIVVVNKWDLLEEDVRQAREEEIVRRNRKERREGQEKEMSTLGEFGGWVQKKLFFLDYAPVIFTSAKSGFHLDRLLEAMRYVAAQLQQKIPTAILNRTLRDAVERRQPVSNAGTSPEIFLRDAGQAGAADVSAVRQPRRTVFRPIQKISGRPDAAGLWLRRLSHRAGAKTAPPNRGADSQTQARVPETVSRIWLHHAPKNGADFCSQRRISCGFCNTDAGFSRLLLWEYRSCNFFENFSCHHNMLGIGSLCCPLNGVLPEISRLAESYKAG